MRTKCSVLFEMIYVLMIISVKRHFPVFELKFLSSIHRDVSLIERHYKKNDFTITILIGNDK